MLLFLYPYQRNTSPWSANPHRHSMLVPTVCAPRVTRCSLGKYWSRDWFRGNFSLTQGLWNQQAANPGVHMLSMTHSGVRQRNIYDACTVPTPCLLLPALTFREIGQGMWSVLFPYFACNKKAFTFIFSSNDLKSQFELRWATVILVQGSKKRHATNGNNHMMSM